MKIFLICPVRNATQEQITKLKQYKEDLKSKRIEVFYPADDNPLEKTDKIGYNICITNASNIKDADEVHIFWDKTSTGSLFDLGVAFALNKPLKIVNIDEVEPTETKSFSNMVLEWHNKYAPTDE